jgi:hypothetical protein
MTSTGFGLLSLITFFPLVGALAIAALNKEAKGNARWIALYMTLFTLGASIYLWANFDQGNPGFQFVEEMDWLGGSIRYKRRRRHLRCYSWCSPRFSCRYAFWRAGRRSMSA